MLDFTRPVALMFVAVLHCFPDEGDPAAITARYLAALAPGSYLVLSYSADEFAPDRTHQASAEAKERGATWIPPQQGRHPAHVQRPGTPRPRACTRLPLAAGWRVPGRNADQAWSYGGIALI